MCKLLRVADCMHLNNALSEITSLNYQYELHVLRFYYMYIHVHVYMMFFIDILFYHFGDQNRCEQISFKNEVKVQELTLER